MTDEDKIHAAEEPSDQIELDTSSYLDSPFLHDDIVGLIRKQEWRIRKLVVHDFSGHDEYTLRTTMDVDTEWISEHLLLGNSRDPLAIPMDWRPKRQVLALDARASTGGSAHIIRRSRNEAVDRYLMAEAITGAQPSEDHQDNQELPKCITLLISQLVDEDLDSASTSIYDLLESTQERIKGLAPHGLFTSECTATQCDGQEIWDNAMRNSRALSQIALLTAGYIRSVVVERPSRNTPVVIIKTSEVPAASPFDIHPPARSNSTFVQFILRRCRYLALGQWVVRKTLSLPFPGDAGLIKCKAPTGLVSCRLERPTGLRIYPKCKSLNRVIGHITSRQEGPPKRSYRCALPRSTSLPAEATSCCPDSRFCYCASWYNSHSFGRCLPAHLGTTFSFNG